jgi:hypothetical protein
VEWRAGRVGWLKPGAYSFNLGAYPDHTYVLSVTQTDAAGNISPAATDSLVLDRMAFPPTFEATPADISSDSTPTWVFYGEFGADFQCNLMRSGSTTPIETVGCTQSQDFVDQTYTVDLGAYPDDTYTLSITQTDRAGNTSAPATDDLQNLGSRRLLPAALQLDVPDSSLRFEDEVVAPGVDIRSDHLDGVMPDEPAVLEHLG